MPTEPAKSRPSPVRRWLKSAIATTAAHQPAMPFQRSSWHPVPAANPVPRSAPALR